MNSISDIVENLQDRFFNHLVTNRLIYNTCWEDPRVDRELLNIKNGSNVLMLTSAGCNAFDYLLDYPAYLCCVDSNPAQNALLEFKKALFQNADYELLWQFFGKGYHPNAALVYNRHIRSLLPDIARSFWDGRINYFSRTAENPSFYFRGTTGRIAYMLYRYIRRKGLYGSILKLLNSQSMEEQRYYYEEVDPHLWNGFYPWLLKQDPTLSMLGVPRTQRRMISPTTQNGILNFIRSSIRHVMTNISIHDNYFWRVYLTGHYTPNCAPNYLRRDYFQYFNNFQSRISTHTSTLIDYLDATNQSYSHFILLDHQDWLAGEDTAKLKQEWKNILAHAEDGARILFRSAGTDRSFLPEFVQAKVTFEDVKTRRLHSQDRVGTYGSTHLGIVTHD